MKNNLLNSVKQVVKYWWISLLIGVLAIILGTWCVAAPTTTLLALSILFITSFIVSGIFEIVFAVSNKDILSGWGWTLASGIINLIFGFILLAIPLESMIILIFYVGFWVLFQSIWVIGSSIELQRVGVKGWGWLLTFGILGLILAYILITNPVFASSFIVMLFSFTLVFYGFMRIFYGFRLRSINKKIKEIEKESKL